MITKMFIASSRHLVKIFRQAIPPVSIRGERILYEYVSYIRVVFFSMRPVFYLAVA